MNWYRVSLMRIGHAMVQAESEEAAKRKAGLLSKEDIHWLEEQNELTGPYLVTYIELTDRAKPPHC